MPASPLFVGLLACKVVGLKLRSSHILDRLEKLYTAITESLAL
jgi:hypothetical protein